MRLFRFAVLAVIALLGAGRHDTVFAAESTSYPITIKHAFGNTMIAKKPERVATVAWANHEVPLALGIVPVGMARANFGDDDRDGILPWVDARLGELKAEKPVLFDEGDGIDFEAVAATRPDVILAAYSGLSQADYDTLSDIAPVIAYPQAPWSTDWRETIRLNSAGLGMAAEGEGLVASIEAEIALTLDGHPELKGKSAMFITHLSSWDLSVVNFYTTNDTRVRFFGDLGLMSPKSVVQASQPGRFSGSVSAEQIDAFDDVDILVTYGDGMLFDALKANALMRHMPAVARESIVMLGNNAVGNAANPTPLSIRWVLKDYVKLLSEAVKKSQ
ncbi:ABC transporter, periplasmic solute-binding protein [Sinorhizobium meliloti CCNWSX0020]|uniref:ABC transporter, periplasmic solute-binding protein n=1 Tax=Sinorhizobium meliloti CCNWSX0020 TaxID=1107881 RepID=H0G1T8_RHIML|nr:iron-siderophore ABC transporter substrate-binding protein [Sinorhizobium meliloti]EHK76682.1 ABC transporter, periplasmic solute-binding protein [Sinorhizobium meliloti CCNWSX0020]